MKKKGSNKNIFLNLLDMVSDAVDVIVHKISKFLMDKKKNNIVKAIIRVVCALIIITVLEIPFFLVGKIGEGILYLCNMKFNNLIVDIWCSIIDYAYLIFSLILFFKIIVDMSKKKNYSFEIKNSKQVVNNLYYAIELVLKIIIVISLIPLYLLGILLFAVLGMLIGFLTHGIYILGPILIVVGLLIMIAFLLLYLYDVVYEDREVKNNEK